MREIKFRAWDWKEMFKVSEIKYINWKTIKKVIATDAWYWDDCYAHWEKYSEILMQYTWLKDKNWKEIYEWDIMKSCYWDLTTIIFNDENWRFEWNKSFWCSHKDMKDLLRYGWEIIWNIYENPNLLINN